MRCGLAVAFFFVSSRRRHTSSLRDWSSDVCSSDLAAPMQHVAAYVLSEPPEVREHVAASRRLHEAVSLAAWERLVGAGVECRRPGGGFYLYPDFEPLRGRLGIETAEGLTEVLLERFGIAVLAG